MRECWARRWELGKLAAARTGKLPLGSFASWDWPPPHALSNAPAAIATATAQALLRLLLLKARRNIPPVIGLHDGSNLLIARGVA
jgi:hypothetical protein